jgi:hypothetical protein
LDRKNLTVVADTVYRPLSLPQIGSGESWVGYRVAAHLALHKLFRTLDRPVPAFLMLDQPSQAHYPKEKDVGEISAPKMRIKWRLHAVQADIRVLHDPGPNMQVIVADHVDLLQEWFRASTVQRWREGIKLVPMTWLR